MKTLKSKVLANNHGLILLAHGSRNPAWRKPFDKVLRSVKKHSDSHAMLAFGEFMQPTLLEATQQLAALGVQRAVIVPLFLGGGAHVRSDIPRDAQATTQATGVKLKIAKTIGESTAVLDAMAQYCVLQGATRKRRQQKK